MSDPIIYIDQSEVRAGKLEELRKAVSDLANLAEASEPRLIAYQVYFTAGGTRMTVIHVHPDSASLELHMKVGGPAFPKFGEFLTLLAIDIYGKPSDHALEQLRQKARMLGDGTVRVHELHAGFARLGAR